MKTFFTVPPVPLTFSLTKFAKINWKWSRAKQRQPVSGSPGFSGGNWKHMLAHVSTQWLLASSQHGGWLPRAAVPRESRTEALGDILPFVTPPQQWCDGPLCQNCPAWCRSPDPTLWASVEEFDMGFQNHGQPCCLVSNLFAFVTPCFETTERVVRAQTGNCFPVWGNFIDLKFSYPLFYTL